MLFNQLGLNAEILSAINDAGYKNATPIQSQAIPVVLKGNDVMAGAETGTGKTAAFTLPLLQRLVENSNPSHKKVIRALVLTPTRELASQVHESVCSYGKYLNLKSTTIVGGVNIQPQIKKLQRGVDILVATPGRLLDHVRQKTVNLSKVEFLVLDEADRMLDMGFIPDVKKIHALLPKQRQNLLFFATFSNEVKKLADDLLKSPVLIEVAQRNIVAKNITQNAYPVAHSKKSELLSFLIGSKNWKQVLVFTRTKHGANRLSEKLEHSGLSATAIHGNKSQGARTRALESFKKGKVRVLVATDVASRGLDINQLSHVVNFDLPTVAADYIHRIGRTGRAGQAGEAVSLVSAHEISQLKDIEKLIKTTITHINVPGYEVDLTHKAKRSSKSSTEPKKHSFKAKKSKTKRRFKGTISK